MGKRNEDNGHAGRVPSLLEQEDKDLWAAYLQKRREGRTPSNQERAGWKRYEKFRTRRDWEAHCRALPQRDFRDLFGGVHTKQLQDWERNWSLPVAQASIDLFEVGKRLWKLLGQFGRQRSAGDDPDAGLLEGASKALKDQLLKEKIRIERMKADEMEKKAVYWDQLQPALVDLGTGLKKAGETLQRQYGPDAAGVLEEALDEFERRIGEMDAAG